MRYFIIELLTSLVFLGLFILYFYTDLRDGIRPFLSGGWLIYLMSVTMLAAFIAASAIDLEPERINIKATTTEGLGMIGKGAGIGALCVAMIE